MYTSSLFKSPCISCLHLLLGASQPVQLPPEQLPTKCEQESGREPWEAGQGLGTSVACLELSQNVCFSGILSTEIYLICTAVIRSILHLHQGEDLSCVL